GFTGDAHRSRRRLLDPAQPAREGLVSTQSSRRWTPGGSRESGGDAVGVLVLRVMQTRTQRRQRAIALAGACAAVLLSGPGSVPSAFVSSVTSVSLAAAAAARPGSIRGRVDIRRVAAPSERRPGVADLGAPANPRDLPDLLRSV